MLSLDSPTMRTHSRIRRIKSELYDYLLTNNPDELRDQIISRNNAESKPVKRFFEASKTVARSFSEITRICRSPETMSLLEKARLLTSANMGGISLMQYSLFSAVRGVRTFFNSPSIKEIFLSEESLLSCLLPFGWAYENDYQLPPVGGSQVIPEWLCRILTEWNASISMNARVEQISVDNMTATGVRGVQNGRQFDIQAKYVIAACDVESIFNKLLPSGCIDKRMLRKQRNADVFNSCATISLGIDCLPCELGFDEEQVVLRRGDVSREEHSCGIPDKTEISIIASSFRDPSLAPRGKGIVTVYAPAFMNYGNYWATQRDSNGQFIRGKAYKEFKKQYADTILSRVEKMFIPDLRSHMETIDIATPFTYMRYTGNRFGAIMGFRPSTKNILGGVAGYTTPVKNLFVGGQWAEISGGVPVAVRAGMNSALMILRKESPDYYKTICDVVDGNLAASELPVSRSRSA